MAIVMIFLTLGLMPFLFMAGRKLVLASDTKVKKYLWSSLFLAILIFISWATYQPTLGIRIFPLDYYLYFYEVLFGFPAALFIGSAIALLDTRPKKILVTAMGGLVFAYCMQSVISMAFLPDFDFGGNTVGSNGICIQSTGYTCGASACVTALHGFGIRSTEEEMAALTHTRYYRGVTDVGILAGMKQKVEPFGLDADLLAPDWEELKKVRKPCVASVRWGIINHALVISKIEDDRVYILDPLKGNVINSKEEFLGRWTGTVIVIYKDSPYESQ